jgi:ABC-type transport system involved in multi-copper enzyme maturation permease subunit
MLHLLKIDLKKLTSYRTFWVIVGLYFFTLGMATASGMEFLKWLANMIEGFGQSINIDRIPLYHFPDVWQNLAWSSGLLKIMLGIMVLISITNEYSYRTLRQNIIDGLSRSEFLLSKVMTNLVLSALSMVLVFLIALVTGLIYSPQYTDYMFNGIEFYPAYFLEVFAFLSFALMLGIFVQRSGLSIVLLLNSYLIELIIKENIDEYVPELLIQIFPLESIMNLVPMPWARYAFQEIQDYVSLTAVGIAIVWTFLFNYFSYLKLKKADI